MKNLIDIIDTSNEIDVISEIINKKKPTHFIEVWKHRIENRTTCNIFSEIKNLDFNLRTSEKYGHITIAVFLIFPKKL